MGCAVIDGYGLAIAATAILSLVMLIYCGWKLYSTYNENLED